MSLAILDNFVYVCPEFGEEFETLEEYLEYSEGQHDYFISDHLGASYHFPSIADYQKWATEELINNGKSLERWIREQQTLETNKNYNHDKATGILLCCHTRGRQLFRLSSEIIRKSIRRSNCTRKTSFA